jgi:hypothetical protein
MAFDVQNRRFVKKVACALALLVSGCFPGYYGPRANLINALWTAAVVGTAISIAVHDAHMHSEACGHYRQWHEGRWVYWYGDHWEYYDEPSGQWFIYQQ